MVDKVKAPDTASIKKERLSQEKAPAEDVWIPTSCRVCVNSCGLVVHRNNGILVKIEGNPFNPHNNGRICAKGMAQIMSLYDPNRVTKPLRRTNPEKGVDIDPKWKEISWEEALETAVEHLRSVLADDPRKLVIHQATGESEWTNMCHVSFAEVLGTPNYSLGGFSGAHSPLHYLNTGAMHTEVDWERCRLLILFGCQKGSASGHDMVKAALALAEARARGMKLVVVDPVCTPIASKAQQWLPIRPGTDGALALSMLHVLLNEEGVYDHHFLQTQTNAPYLVNSSGHYIRDPDTGKPLMWDLNRSRPCFFDDAEAGNLALEGEFRVGSQPCKPAFQRLKEHLKEYTPERVAGITTIPVATIRSLAQEFGQKAAIGSTLSLEGQQLPFRPVCAYPDTQGATAHRYGLWAGTAIQMLNVVVGSVDVPGGIISTNIIGPRGKMRVKASDEGIIEASGAETRSRDSVYPARKISPPQSVSLLELFPTGHVNAAVMMGLSMGPLAYLLPYRPEMFIVNYANTLMIGSNPNPIAEALKQIPFMVFLGDKVHETAEFADIFLPIQHGLERLDFPMNSLRGWVTGDHWYFALRQPVVKPEPGPKHPVEILFELSERLGVLDKVQASLNARLGIKEPYSLEPTKRHSVEDILDSYMKSMLGEEHDMAWFKEHGVLAFPRKLEERFPRAVRPMPRLPIYFEYLIEAGKELDKLAQKLDLNLDLSGFQPLPLWGPCLAHTEHRQEYDLFAVNYKLAFHAFSVTQANPWLEELSSHHPYAYRIWINEDTARHKGISQGDTILVESTAGTRVIAQARLSQCIHPEVVGIASCFGRWARGLPVSRNKGPHFGTLVPYGLDHMDLVSCRVDFCARVKVSRAGP